jgi:hypothetical protein
MALKSSVFLIFVAQEVPSKPLPSQTDLTPAMKGNIKECKRIKGKEERPKIPEARV